MANNVRLKRFTNVNVNILFCIDDLTCQTVGLCGLLTLLDMRVDVLFSPKEHGGNQGPDEPPPGHQAGAEFGV